MEQTLAQLPSWFWTMVAVMLGAVWGSFLNVVIYRVPNKISVVSPPSACPKCKANIAWYDNVPVFAWIWLGGKCRKCKAAISPRYPMIELLTAMLSWALMVRFGPTGSYVLYFVFICLLVSLTFIDLDLWLLPDALTYPGMVIGLVGAATLLPDRPIADHALAALIGAALFMIVLLVAKWIMKKDGMGYGDVKLLAMLGAFLGTGSLYFIVMLSSVQAVIIGVVWLRINRNKPPPPPQEDGFVPDARALPYGPFLALAGLEYLFFSDQLHALIGAVRSGG